jgi:enoyl-CoA hydratase
MGAVVDIRVEREGALLRAIVRLSDVAAPAPAALAPITDSVERLGRDPELYAMVVHGAHHLSPERLGASRAQCAPGDAELRAAATRFAWVVDCCPKPVVTVVDGAADGLLGGLATHTTHAVAGTGYALRLGASGPNQRALCGVSHVLARLPVGVGAFLTSTGAALGAREALALGLLTHVLAAGPLSEVERRLVDADPIDPLLDVRHEPGAATTRPLPAPAVLACFAREERGQILAALARLDASYRETGAALIRLLEERSAAAIDENLALLRRARSLDLRETMLLELAVAEGASPEAAPIADPLHLPTRRSLQLYRD